jgi:hypothetical protein
MRNKMKIALKNVCFAGLQSAPVGRKNARACAQLTGFCDGLDKYERRLGAARMAAETRWN